MGRNVLKVSFSFWFLLRAVYAGLRVNLPILFIQTIEWPNDGFQTNCMNEWGKYNSTKHTHTHKMIIIIMMKAQPIYHKANITISYVIGKRFIIRTALHTILCYLLYAWKEQKKKKNKLNKFKCKQTMDEWMVWTDMVFFLSHQPQYWLLYHICCRFHFSIRSFAYFWRRRV